MGTVASLFKKIRGFSVFDHECNRFVSALENMEMRAIKVGSSLQADQSGLNRVLAAAQKLQTQVRGVFWIA